VITLISVSMNVGNVLIVLVSSFFMDRLGRRPLLLMSVGGMGCACLLLTLALVLGSNALVCVAVVRRAWPRWPGQGRGRQAKAALRAAARAATHASPAARAACSWRPSAPERGGREGRPGGAASPRGCPEAAKPSAPSLALCSPACPKLAGDPAAAWPCRCSS